MGRAGSGFLPAISPRTATPPTGPNAAGRARRGQTPRQRGADGRLIGILSTLRNSRGPELALRALQQADQLSLKSPQFRSNFFRANGTEAVLGLVEGHLAAPGGAGLVAAALTVLRHVKDDPVGHAALVSAGGLRLVFGWMAAFAESAAVQLGGLFLLQGLLSSSLSLGEPAEAVAGQTVALLEQVLEQSSGLPQALIAVAATGLALTDRRSTAAYISAHDGTLLPTLFRTAVKYFRAAEPVPSDGAAPAAQASGSQRTGALKREESIVLRHVCQYLAAAMRLSEAAATKLFAMGGLDVATAALELSPADFAEGEPTRTESALGLLTEMLQLPALAHHPAAAAINHLVVQSLALDWSQDAVPCAGSKVLWVLSGDPDTATQLISMQPIPVLLQLLDRHPDSHELHKHILRTICNLLVATDSGTIAADFQPHMLSVLDTIKRHATAPDVAASGCVMLSRFANWPAGKQSLVDNGGIELALALMVQHPSHKDLLHDVIGLLINLLTHSKAVQHNVTRMGGIRALLRILDDFPNSPLLLGMAFWALANLVCNCNVENQMVLLQQGALVKSIELLARHSTKPNTVARALAFLSNMVEGNEKVCIAMIRIKLVERAMAVVEQEDESPPVLQHTATLLSNILKVDGQLASTREAALKLLDRCLQARPSTPSLVIQACRATESLLLAGSDPADVPALQRIATALLGALPLEPESTPVFKVSVLSALTALMPRNVLADEDCDLVIGQLCVLFLDVTILPNVLADTASAIQTVLSYHSSCKMPRRELVLQLAVEVLHQHSSNVTIAALCRLSAILLRDSSHCQNLVRLQGGVASFLQLIRTYESTPEVLVPGSQALYHLCLGSIEASAQIEQELHRISAIIANSKSALVITALCNVLCAAVSSQQGDTAMWELPCHSIITTMKAFSHDKQLQISALALLAALATCSEQVLELLIRLGAMAVIVSGMRMHAECATVQAASGKAIAGFSQKVERKRWVGEQGGIEMVTMALHQNLWQLDVQRMCLNAAATLLEGCRPNMELAGESGMLQPVLLDRRVVEQCCVALAQLTRDCAVTSIHALAQNATGLLISVLNRFSEHVETIANAFEVLNILTSGCSTTGTQGFMDANGFLTLCSALRAHSSAERVIVEASGLVCNVTRGQGEFQQDFADLGGVDLLLDVLESSTVVNVQSSLCAALGCLIINQNCFSRNPDVTKRAICLIIAVMGTEHALCLANAAFALSSLCFAHPANIKLVCEKNGVALVLGSMRTHQESRDVQLSGSLFIAAACTVREAHAMASKFSAVRQLVMLLIRFLADSQLVREAARGLAVLLTNNKTNQESFVERGGVPAVMDALQQHNADEATCIELTKLINVSLVFCSPEDGETAHLVVTRQLLQNDFNDSFSRLTPNCRANKTIERQISSIVQWVSMSS